MLWDFHKEDSSCKEAVYIHFLKSAHRNLIEFVAYLLCSEVFIWFSSVPLLSENNNIVIFICIDILQLDYLLIKCPLITRTELLETYTADNAHIIIIDSI